MYVSFDEQLGIDPEREATPSGDDIDMDGVFNITEVGVVQVGTD